MSRQIGVSIAIFCGTFVAAAQQRSLSPFHEHRAAASDLKVTGLVTGIPAGESRFVLRSWLAALPQVTLTMKRSEDFSGIGDLGVRVTGVSLEVLVRSLGAEMSATAIEAVCADGYVATYSSDYLRRHRPVFVLTMEGLSPHEWALKNHQYDAQPYFVAHEDFVPSFHILSHPDQPMEPSEVVELRFDTEEHVFAGIVPKRNDLAAMQGYRIARQSCFRCHHAGDQGGRKAPMSWSDLGSIAKDRPRHFAAWVKNPQAIDPQADMPANPEYDRATLSALQRYFSSFAAEGQ